MPVIFNANAGQKLRGPLGAISEDALREVLAANGIEARIAATDSEEAARAEVRRLVAAGERLIVAAGGDGTIGQVARELLGTDVALGMLPLGSVMNIPRMLGLPRDLAEAAELLAAPAPRTAVIDVGEAAGRVFFEAASVGLGAAMFSAAQHFEDGDWGSPLKVLWMAFRYRPARMEIELDGGALVRTRGLMVVVANGAYAGAGMTIAPDARLDDSRFDVRVFRHFSKFELLRHLASIMFGRRAYVPHVETHRSAFVRIVGRWPLPCRADSHDLGTTPLECRVLPRALKVVVGPDFVDGRPA
jgi:diacylglycerol kinase (ATP)